MKAPWVIVLVVAICVLAFFTGRWTAPQPPAPVVVPGEPAHTVLPDSQGNKPAQPQIVHHWHTVVLQDSEKIQQLTQELVNKDSAIMELMKKQIWEGAWKWIQPLPDSLRMKASHLLVDGSYYHDYNPYTGKDSSYVGVYNVSVPSRVDTIRVPDLTPQPDPWYVYPIGGAAIIGATYIIVDLARGHQ